MHQMTLSPATSSTARSQGRALRRVQLLAPLAADRPWKPPTSSSLAEEGVSARSSSSRRRTIRTLGLRQLRHDQVVGGVDQILDLIRRDRPVEGKGVPAVLADIGHLGRSALIAVDQQIGSFTVTTLQANRRLIFSRAQEGEDLVANLGDDIALPRLVLPGAWFGEAVVKPSRYARHSVRIHPHNVATQLVICCAPASPDFSGWNWVDQSGPSSTAATKRSPQCSVHVTRSRKVEGSRVRTP